MELNSHNGTRRHLMSLLPCAGIITYPVNPRSFEYRGIKPCSLLRFRTEPEVRRNSLDLCHNLFSMTNEKIVPGETTASTNYPGIWGSGYYSMTATFCPPTNPAVCRIFFLPKRNLSHAKNWIG